MRRFGRWTRPESGHKWFSRTDPGGEGSDRMLCMKCGFYSEKDENVCPSCGSVLRYDSHFQNQGAQAIRQGKKAREAIKNKASRNAQTETEIRKKRSGASHATLDIPKVADDRTLGDQYFDSYLVPENPAGSSDGPSYERRRRAVYDDTIDSGQAEKYLASLETGNRNKRHMVNWMKVTIISAAVIIILAFGAFGMLRWTDGGQKIMAYLWLKYPNLETDISTSALWSVGDESMEAGRIDDAIRCYERAKLQDEEKGFVDVDGLLNLGNAYEAFGDTEKAAGLYELIYTETPSRSEAYVAHIRILQNSGKDGDLAKAGELLNLAYEKTGEETFRTQRGDFLPKPPTVNLTAGYYETKKNISLTSYQGYDIYWTFDEEAELPAGGTRFTAPIPLEEGIYNLRAVAVNGELVSDELRGTYKIIMPQPQKPQANLAQATYKTSQRVRLKPGKDNINDDDIIIYYTIDGSEPDADSPIYNGDPIQLPNGRVTLQAVAVNRFRKLSNKLVLNYKIEANPKPKSAFSAEDTLDSIILGTTTQLEFQEKYGEGTPAGEVQSGDFSTECRRYNYPWGYAIMNLTRKTWVVVEIYYTSESAFKAPRGTGIGKAEKEITNQYKDMLQVESASGNRGLYSNKDGTGKIWAQEDGGKIIRYRASVNGHWMQIEYYVGKSGTVTAIDMKYIP